MRTTPVHLLQRVVVAALVASCQAPVVTPSAFGGTWWVSALNGTAVDRSGAPEIQFTVGGEVRGSSGCHDFRAPMRVDGAMITVGDAISKPSDWACPKQVRDIEAAFLAALRHVATFTGGRPSCDLVLDGPGGTIALESTGISGTASPCPTWEERHGTRPPT